VRGGIVFAFFFCGLEGRGPCSLRCLLGFSLLSGIDFDLSSKARIFLSQCLISSALRFFRSASSCCILARPSRMAARAGVMLADPKGPTSACLLTPALLWVETIFGEKRVVRCCLVPQGGRQLFL